MVKMPYHEALGGFFITHPPVQEIQVDVRDHNHVLTHNLPASFVIQDEPYWIEVLHPETRVLLTMEMPENPDPDFAMLYDEDTSLLPDGKSRALGFAVRGRQCVSGPKDAAALPRPLGDGGLSAAVEERRGLGDGRGRVAEPSRSRSQSLDSLCCPRAVSSTVRACRVKRHMFSSRSARPVSMVSLCSPPGPTTAIQVCPAASP